MKAFPKYWIAFGFLVASLAILGCDDAASTGGADMDALAAQLAQSKKAAADAAAAEQARAAAAQAAAEKAAADQAAADQAAAELAAKQAAQPTGAESETSITITVKNPQGLLNGMQPGDGTTRTTAGAGTIGQGGGYYSAIAAAHRHITTRVDDLAWTQAVRSYWAENGHYPKSHEEFMQGVIEAYGVELPALEQGEEYLYDPSEGDFGTLYVVTKEPPPQQPATPAPLQ